MEFTLMTILAQKGSTIYPNTNLPITLWLKPDQKKIIYMQNNYNKYTTGNDLIPISIDKDNPQILSETPINVSDKDLKKVLNFIKKKYQSLINMVDDVAMDYSIMEYTYINKFKPTVVDGFFTNQIGAKHYKNLPVDLYLYCNNIKYDDERNLYSLLMVNTYDKIRGFENCVTVSIDKDNPQLLYDVELKISNEDFAKVQEFIKRNYDFFDRYIKDEDISTHALYCHLDLEEESYINIGITKDNYYIYINTSDIEKYPHFHYVDSITKGDNFSTCIKIDKEEYLNHQINRNDKLTEKQRTNLQEFLNSNFKDDRFKGTNWDYIVALWNMNNTIQVDESKPIPNYETLN